jgi:hypothetical protein
MRTAFDTSTATHDIANDVCALRVSHQHNLSVFATLVDVIFYPGSRGERAVVAGRVVGVE